MVLSSGAMSDLLHGARDLRQKLYRLEVLLEIEKGGRSRIAGKAPHAAERAAAIKRLTDAGFIEAAAPPPRRFYRIAGADHNDALGHPALLDAVASFAREAVAGTRPPSS